MSSDKELKRLSKLLSWGLRHRPDELGVVLDGAGWTDVDLLLEALQLRWPGTNRDLLIEVVTSNAKKRFAFDETGRRIRANQGHSVEVDLGYVAQEPPEVLYHGSSVATAESIARMGIERRERHHVHLSSTVELARTVGGRHGKPFVWVVRAGEMFREGFAFFLSDNGVWLCEFVPPQFIEPIA